MKKREAKRHQCYNWLFWTLWAAQVQFGSLNWGEGYRINSSRPQYWSTRRKTSYADRRSCVRGNMCAIHLPKTCKVKAPLRVTLWYQQSHDTFKALELQLLWSSTDTTLSTALVAARPVTVRDPSVIPISSPEKVSFNKRSRRLSHYGCSCIVTNFTPSMWTWMETSVFSLLRSGEKVLWRLNAFSKKSCSKNGEKLIVEEDLKAEWVSCIGSECHSRKVRVMGFFLFSCFFFFFCLSCYWVKSQCRAPLLSPLIWKR